MVKKIFFFIFLGWLAILSMRGQTKVRLFGKVTDAAGEGLPLATVGIEPADKLVKTGIDGRFQLLLPPGTYVLKVGYSGFRTSVVKLLLKAERECNVVLQEDVLALDSVYVYGKSSVSKLKEGGLALNVIDVKTMVNGLAGLDALVDRTTGVRIRREGGVGSDFDMSINGMSGNSVRYFVDGVPLDAQGSGVNLSNFPVNLVDRVEVYKGVVPTQLGADALGGAVNIVTRRGKGNYLDASYGVGSFHTHRADLNAQWVDRRTGLTVRPTVAVNYSKNDYKVRGVELWNEDAGAFLSTDRKRFHDDYLSAFARLDVGVGGKPWADELFVSASYSKENKELQTGVVQSVVYGMAERQADAWSVAARYRKMGLWQDRLSINTSASYTWDHALTVDTAYRKYSWDGGFVERPRNEVTGRNRSMRHYKRPLFIASLNADCRFNSRHALNVNYQLQSMGNKRSDDVDATFEPSNDRFTKHILGIAYQQSLYGGRWHNSFFVKEYVNHLSVGQNDLSWITGADKVPSAFTHHYEGYGLASRFGFGRFGAAKLSYEHSIRLPLAREMLGNGTTIYPNLQLNPEHSNNVNVGLDGKWVFSGHSLTYEVNGFFRNVKDYIHAQVTTQDGTMQYQNVNDVNVKGIEGEMAYGYAGWLRFWGNCSFQDSRSRTRYKANGTPDVTYNNKVPNKPWLFAHAGGELKRRNCWNRGLTLGLSYNYQYVHWFYLMWEKYGTKETNSLIPTQHLHSVTLSGSWGDERYNLSLTCDNVCDAVLYDNYKLQKPGRSFYCKFRIFING